MFEATTGANQLARRSPLAGILSVLFHGGLVAALLLVTMCTKQVIEEKPETIDLTFFSAPPPPPPPPPPASTTTQKKKKKKKVEKKPDIKPEELVQPEEIPEEIPEETEEDVEEVEDDEEIVDAGVVGGVEGGVAGGVVGGEIGGVEGGVIGGELGSLSIREADGKCRKPSAAAYPEAAKNMGIEGTVRLRMILNGAGRIAKAKDEVCRGWIKADKKTRRTRWHPNKCIEAIAGPEMLYFDALNYWSGIKCAGLGDPDTWFEYIPQSNYKLN